MNCTRIFLKILQGAGESHKVEKLILKGESLRFKYDFSNYKNINSRKWVAKFFNF